MKTKFLFPILAVLATPLAADPPKKADHHQHGKKEVDPMDHDFKDAAAWAKRFDDPERAAWQKPEEVVSLMAIEAGMIVADLGAGTGYFLGHLAQAVGPTGRVLGLDPEPKMVAYMQTRIDSEGLKQALARVVPYDEPGLGDASVDRVLIVNTWHHIDQRGEYSAKLLQTLRAGGAVFVVDFTLESPVGPNKSHRLEAEAVIAELTAGGFAAELLEETLPNQYIVVGRRPQ